MWDPSDKSGFFNSQVGQITTGTKFGQYLYNLAKDTNISTYLEIGTWNGLGSTKCIIEGLKERQSSINEYIFYSLECNKEKSLIAADYYKNIPGVHILNEVLYNNIPDDNELIFPELSTNEQFKYWNYIDYENMKDKPLFLNRTNLPKMFDFVLLDGGEFTTWYEYLIINDRAKVLALDDINVNKCHRIVQDLKSQPDKWDIMIEDRNERNGFMIAMRKDLTN